MTEQRKQTATTKSTTNLFSFLSKCLWLVHFQCHWMEFISFLLSIFVNQQNININMIRHTRCGCIHWKNILFTHIAQRIHAQAASWPLYAINRRMCMCVCVCTLSLLFIILGAVHHFYNKQCVFMCEIWPACLTACERTLSFDHMFALLLNGFMLTVHL